MVLWAQQRVVTRIMLVNNTMFEDNENKGRHGGKVVNYKHNGMFCYAHWSDALSRFQSMCHRLTGTKQEIKDVVVAGD